MNCEEYVIERIHELEKTNKNLNRTIVDQENTIENLIEKIDAFKDLFEKAQLEFKDSGCYYGLNFKGLYLTLNDKGKKAVREIVNDLKILNLSNITSDIVAKCEQKEKEEND